MTVIESKPVETGRSAEDLFVFLSDITSWQSLMPPQVEGWQADGDACRFRIKGLAGVGLRITGRNAHHEVLLAGEEPAPFDFTLACRIEPAGNGSRLTLRMEAGLNPMLRSLASQPLVNFLNYLAERCKT
jgi:hypothetical protein